MRSSCLKQSFGHIFHSDENEQLEQLRYKSKKKSRVNGECNTDKTIDLP